MGLPARPPGRPCLPRDGPRLRTGRALVDRGDRRAGRGVAVTPWLPAVSAAVAAALVRPPRPVFGDTAPPTAGPGAPHGPGAGRLHRHRLVWSGLAGLGGLLLVTGRAAPAGAGVAGGAAPVVLGRGEPAERRGRREAVRRDLPYVVELFAATLRGGAAPGDGI